MPLRFPKLDRPSMPGLKSGEKIMEHAIATERLMDGDVRYSVYGGPLQTPARCESGAAGGTRTPDPRITKELRTDLD